MKSNLLHVYFALDESESMYNSVDDTTAMATADVLLSTKLSEDTTKYQKEHNITL